MLGLKVYTITPGMCVKRLYTEKIQPDKMSQWIKVLASKPVDLSSISGSPMEEADNWLHKFCSGLLFKRESEKGGGNLNKKETKYSKI